MDIDYRKLTETHPYVIDPYPSIMPSIDSMKGPDSSNFSFIDSPVSLYSGADESITTLSDRAEYYAPIEWWQKMSPLDALLHHALYKQYQDHVYLSELKGLLDYYYTDYHNLLSLIPGLGWIASEESQSFLIYLQAFQQSVEHNLESRGKSLLTIHQRIVVPLQHNDSAIIDFDMSDAISQLEFALHHLTELQLLAYIEHILAFAKKTKNHVDSLDIKQLAQRLDVISSIADAIKAWGEFINQLYPTPLGSVDYTDQEARHRAVSKRHGYIQAQFTRMLLQPVQHAIAQFKENAKIFDSEAMCVLSNVKTAIESYREASQGMEILSIIKESIGSHVVDDFHSHAKQFEEASFHFLKQNTQHLFLSFEQHYTALQTTLTHPFGLETALFDVYKPLKDTLDTWRDFIEQCGASTSLLETLADYAAAESKLQKGIITTPYFLNVLFSIFEQEALVFDCADSSQKSLKDKFIILNAVKSILAYAELSWVKPDGAAQDKHNAKLVCEEYKKQCEVNEQGLKTLCLEIQEKIEDANDFFSKTLPLNKNRCPPLNRIVAIKRYAASIENYTTFVHLCLKYGGASWVLNDNSDDATFQKINDSTSQIADFCAKANTTCRF